MSLRQRNAKLFHQLYEQRIGPAVADDKAGIDINAPCPHCAGVPARVRLFLKQSCIVMRVKQPRRPQTRDAAANDRNAQTLQYQPRNKSSEIRAQHSRCPDQPYPPQDHIAGRRTPSIT